MCHQSGESQCASLVVHVQDTLPKKLNANQILNSIHSHVDLQYKSVLCMCVLKMCADSGSGTREQTAEETSDLAFDYPCIVAIHQHWQLGQGSVLCMCVLERVAVFYLYY